MEISTAQFIISERINSKEVRVAVPLAQPLDYQEQGDSEFETFQCRVINARRLSGTLPRELEPYRDWTIRDVRPLFQ